MVHRQFRNAAICDSEPGTIRALIPILPLHLDNRQWRTSLQFIAPDIKKTMAQAISGLEPLLIPEEIPVAGIAAEGMLLDDISTVRPNRVFCQGQN
jgi:hypothetical protein